MRKTLIIIFLMFWLPSWNASAEVFRNSYLKFNMPAQWKCEMRKKAYLCRHRVSKACRNNPRQESCKKQVKKSREALIIFTAKEASDQDNLTSYQNYLSEAKTIKKGSGATTKSKLIHNKKVKIANQAWVDSMHLSSELPFYYTRYLATVRGKIAVLVTFSSHKLFYTNYSNEFFKAIKSLQVTTSQVTQVKKEELGKKVLSRPIEIPNELFADSGMEEGGTQTDSTSTILFVLAFLLAAGGVFFWVKNSRR
ncbi:MAG: hypothetical protein AAF203_03015 [Pseudomonadota bacterium]